MPTTVRVQIPLAVFDALVAIADAMPGDTAAERAQHLAAAVEAYRMSIKTGAEYRPLDDMIEDSLN